MTDRNNEPIKVIVAMDFSDELMQSFRDVSPRLDIQRYTPQEVPDSAWQDAEIAYTMRDFPKPEQAPRLRWLQVHFAGLDGALDRPIMQQENVMITSASGVHARPMANYCLMMMLAFNFKLPLMLDFQHKREWAHNQYDIFHPTDLHLQTLGIAGYGSIGRELARLADQLGMKVLASKRDAMRPAESANDYSPEGTGDPEGNIPERIYPSEALASMAQECDYLAVTVPLTPDTQHLINADILEAMKPNSVLINVSRGEVVDQEALIHALKNGIIRGAGLDVFDPEPLPEDSELWQMENVIISPHVSGNSVAYHETVADLFRQNLERYLDHRPLMNKLNRDAGY